jgi:hypothetical protein
MNKKLIIVIGIISLSIMIISIAIITIEYKANYNREYFSSPGMALASRGLYNPEIKYVTITDSFLAKYPVVKDMWDKLDNRTGYLDSSEFPEDISLSHIDTRNLQEELDGLKPENPGYDQGLYVEYQERYYHIWTAICYPYCPPIR